MLLPDKHISLADSLLGLGGFVLEQLDRPRTIDGLYERVIAARENKELPAYHDFDSVVLATLFLYSIDAVELTNNGALRRCVS